MQIEDAIRADKKTLRNSLILVGAVTLIGTLIVLIWVHQRVQVTPAEKERAVTSCTAWVDYYTQEKNPVQICQRAQKEDERQFYRRWTGGGSSIPDSAVK